MISKALKANGYRGPARLPTPTWVNEVTWGRWDFHGIPRCLDCRRHGGNVKMICTLADYSRVSYAGTCKKGIWE